MDFDFCQTCSRGTACNFIHCFRNPGGDYEWANWDNPPPKYWIRKMAVLFGTSDEQGHDMQMALESQERPRGSKRRTPINNRCAHIIKLLLSFFEMCIDSFLTHYDDAIHSLISTTSECF